MYTSINYAIVNIHKIYFRNSKFDLVCLIKLQSQPYQKYVLFGHIKPELNVPKNTE